jgi:hypothetical protein
MTRRTDDIMNVRSESVKYARQTTRITTRTITISSERFAGRRHRLRPWAFLGETEVKNPPKPGMEDERVLRFEIAMDDAACVGDVQYAATFALGTRCLS